MTTERHREISKKLYLLNAGGPLQARLDHCGAQSPETRAMRMTSKKSLQQCRRYLHANAVCLERFFSRRNVELYRKLADRRTAAVKRREILELLAQEQIGFRSDLEGTPKNKKADITRCPL
jgi:hypothetical protein